MYLKDILAVIDINLCSASSRIVDTCRVVPIDEGNDEADCHECALQICTESKRLMFLFPSKIEKASWITALTSSIVGIKSRLAEAESHATGWTHRIMKTSMHSAAFLGDVEMLKKVR